MFGLFSGLIFREYPHDIWPNIWYTRTSIDWILKISHWLVVSVLYNPSCKWINPTYPTQLFRILKISHWLNNQLPKGWVRLPLMGEHPQSLCWTTLCSWWYHTYWLAKNGGKIQESTCETPDSDIFHLEKLGFHIMHIWLCTPIFLVNSIILVISDISHIQSTSLLGATHCQGRGALVFDHLGSIPSSSIKSPLTKRH